VNARRKTLNILSQLRPKIWPLETVNTKIIQTEIRKCEIRLMGILGIIFFSLSKPNTVCTFLSYASGGGACRSKQVSQHRDDTDQNIMKKTFS
jgi:hypothetical protein